MSLSKQAVCAKQTKTPKITQAEKETWYNYTHIRCILVALFSLYNS